MVIKWGCVECSERFPSQKQAQIHRDLTAHIYTALTEPDKGTEPDPFDFTDIICHD